MQLCGMQCQVERVPAASLLFNAFNDQGYILRVFTFQRIQRPKIYSARVAV